jgi:hypothetical protein
MTFTYTADGSRVPFNPATTHAQLVGCLLCGAPVAMVGVFIPATDEMRAVVMRLRMHATRPRSTPCMAYGLCDRHVAEDDVTRRVESALIAAAEQVVLQ